MNDFITKYTTITLVFSCRKFFFEEFKLDELVKNFKTYELYPLNYHSIEKYVKASLPFNHEDFWREVNKRELESILYYPFYLTYLIKRFKEVGQQLPQTKADTLKEFVESEFIESSSKRRLPDGRTLETEKALYYQSIQKLAFALQLSGLNSYQYSDIKQLFSKDERELLEQSSLITTHSKQWSFVNALFQEHLAALQLYNLSIDQIIEYVSIGKKIRKVKTKWVQSYCMLLSIMDDSDKRKTLIEFLKNDNPELLFTIEPTKYRPELRQEFLEELLERSSRLNIRLLSIYENNVAAFIEDSEESINYLIQLLDSPQTPIIVKVICIKTLEKLKLNTNQLNNIYKFVREQIPQCDDSYYAKHLLEILSKEKLGSQEDIDNWITLPINENHEFRDGIYKLVMSLNLVDDYYRYGLQGTEKLINYNKKMHHGDSEHQLEEFLLSTNRRHNLKSLLKLALSPKWREFTDRQASNFFNTLIKRLHEIIKRNPHFIFEVVKFIKAIEKRTLYPEFEKINSLIDTGLTGNLLLRCLFQNLQNQGKELTWDYGALVTPDSFDYIFSEFEEDRISVEGLRMLQFGYQRKDRTNNSTNFQKLCLDITENQLFPPPDPNVIDWSIVETKMKENDIACLQSIEAFKSGLENTFRVFGKKKLNADELYIDSDSKQNRRQIASDIIYRTLSGMTHNNNLVQLSDFGELLTNKDFFSYFRANEIIEYNFTGFPGEESLKQILQQYYNNKIKVANFQNCEWDEENNHIGFKKLECLLVKIFKKFHFPTETSILINMIWVARGSINRTEIKANSDNNRYSLTGLIVERLSNDEIQFFKQKILENIKIGIRSTQVLCNHIGLCGYYNIKGAKDFIFEVIETNRLKDVYYTATCIDIYLKLGGSLAKIEKKFNQIIDYNSHLFTHLINSLKNISPELVKFRLLTALNSQSTTVESKTFFAKHLANLKVNEGFAYLTAFVRQHKRSPYTIQGHIDVHNIDTKFAIEQIRDLMYLVVDCKNEEGVSFTDSAKEILWEWIYGFASKGEEDLILIENLLTESMHLLLGGYPNAVAYFNWYIFRIRGNFRNSENVGKSIKEVKNILQAIED